MKNQGLLVTRRIQTYIHIAMALAIATLLLAGLQSSTTSAVDDTTNTANTLKVSPVRTDITINAGESKTVPVMVTNLTSEAVSVKPVQNDFVAGDEDGTPALILDEDEFAPSHSLKRFMAPLSDVTIPANESKTVNVVITVPKDAQVGGYFGAVRFAPTTPDDGGQVNLSASVASLILLTVPGDVDEKLDLTNVSIQKNGKVGSFFMDATDLQLAVRFQNPSDVQIGPFGKVSIKKGDAVVYEADFNTESPRDMILPDSARRWSVPLDKVNSFGRYTVSATFTYGQDNKTIEVEQSFWVVPQPVIIGSIVGLLALIGAIVGTWLYMRSDKRRANRGRGRVGFRR